ncbi:MAG: glycoside hydrolase family 125 protein [Lachnospiraceae bacterium]
MQQNELRSVRLIEEAKKIADKLCEKLQQKSHGLSDEEEEKLIVMFRQCFLNTIETTVRCINKNEIFLITGDIEAMWLRDSSCQVVHYLSFLNESKDLREMVRDLLWKQFQQIAIDPYANAFNPEPNGACWAKDHTDDNPWEWERKYEIDSLCYPVWLLEQYWKLTQDTSVFTPEIEETLELILTTWKKEQHHMTDSNYYFERDNCPPSDTLCCGGKGTPVGYTGMIWSGFRPSDDACKYGYLVPSNCFAARVCGMIAEIAECIYQNSKLAEQALSMKAEVEAGLQQFAVFEHPVYGKMYAYEVDGLGNRNCMDDANVPSLLALPWLGCVDKEDEIYQNTRKFVLSKDNPFFYEGLEAKGVGSPHTPYRYVWPIALSVQGMTSCDSKEQKEILKTLLHTDAGTGFMHEGFLCDDSTQFTRPWFAWSNSMFAMFVEQILL